MKLVYSASSLIRYSTTAGPCRVCADHNQRSRSRNSRGPCLFITCGRSCDQGTDGCPMPWSYRGRTDLGCLLRRGTLSIGAPHPEQSWGSDVKQEPHQLFQPRTFSPFCFLRRKAVGGIGGGWVKQHQSHNK